MDRSGPRVQADREKEAAFVSPCPGPVIALPEAYRIVETRMFAHQVFLFSMQERPAERTAPASPSL
jgi:hypothetical protein